LRRLETRGARTPCADAATGVQHGYEAEEIIGRHFSVFYAEADADAGKPARELATAAETGRYEEEGWRVRKDCSRFWANVVITAIRDQAGKLLGFAKITRNITERKRQDDRLRAVAEVAQAALEGRREEELLQLIAQRARTLAESALGTLVLVDFDQQIVTIAAAHGPRALRSSEGSSRLPGLLHSRYWLRAGRPCWTRAPPRKANTQPSGPAATSGPL
jgi:PAS domain S-box-containing protein